MGGKFAWVRPDVYPLIAAVSVGCSFGVYIMGRKLFNDSSVELNRTQRQEAVKPEYSGFNTKAEAYHGSAVFERIGKLRSPHLSTEGEMLTSSK